MRWTIQELCSELELDPERRILFVEGSRDIVFWRDCLEPPRRDGTVIYSIGSIDCKSASGGERGRLVTVATQIQNLPIATRIKFFADADTDRILKNALPGNLICTDGRDLEGYAMSLPCLDRFCKLGFPGSGLDGNALLTTINQLGRPIGILRLASARAGLKLPFTRTFERSIDRFFVDLKGAWEVNIPALIGTLIQNSRADPTHQYGLNQLDQFLKLFHQEVTQLAAHSDNQVVHGKDFIRILAWKFDIPFEHAERFLYMCVAIEKAEIRKLRGIQDTEAWLA